jgi:hypothetical protein
VDAASGTDGGASRFAAGLVFLEELPPQDVADLLLARLCQLRVDQAGTVAARNAHLTQSRPGMALLEGYTQRMRMTEIDSAFMR